MFDSWGELLIIAVVALVVVGPKELPQLLRTLGQWVGKARRMAGEFQSQVNEAIREAELDDVKKSVDDLRSLSPKNIIASQLASVGSDLAKVESDTRAELATIGAPGAGAAGSAMSAFTVETPVEPMMASAEAERLIDAAATPVGDLEAPLFASHIEATPLPPEAPMALAEASAPEKEPKS